MGQAQTQLVENSVERETLNLWNAISRPNVEEKSLSSKQLYLALKDKSLYWYQIGLELNLSPYFLEGLVHTGVFLSDSERLEHVLLEWLRTKTVPVSWSEIARVLKSLGCDNVTEFSLKITNMVLQDGSTDDKFQKRTLEIEATLMSFPGAKGILFVMGRSSMTRVTADMDNISRTFQNQLQFAVVRIEILSHSELDIFMAAATSFEYPASIDSIALYASTDEMQDHIIIINHLENPKRKKKFICFLSCGNSFPFKFKRARYFTQMNCVIAHAMFSTKKMVNEMAISLWTSMLCKNLKQRAELSEVLAKTHSDVLEVDSNLFTHFYSCCGPVYLNGVPEHQYITPVISECDQDNEGMVSEISDDKEKEKLKIHQEHLKVITSNSGENSCNFLSQRIEVSLRLAELSLKSQPQGFLFIFHSSPPAAPGVEHIARTFSTSMKFVVDQFDNIAVSRNFFKSITKFQYPIWCKNIVLYITEDYELSDFVHPFLQKIAFFDNPQQRNIIFLFDLLNHRTLHKYFLFHHPLERYFPVPPHCIVSFAISNEWDPVGGSQWASKFCENVKEDVELGVVIAKTHGEVMRSSEKIHCAFQSCAAPIYLKNPCRQIALSQTPPSSLTPEVFSDDEPLGAAPTPIVIQTYINWMNNVLKGTEIKVKHWDELNDGVILLKLLEALSSHRFPESLNLDNPDDVQKKENLTCAFEFMANEKLMATDDAAKWLAEMLECRSTCVLLRIIRILQHYHFGIKVGDDINVLVLKWIRATLRNHEISNLSYDWSNGAKLLELIDILKPGLNAISKYHHKFSLASIQAALDLAEAYLGIPQIVKPKYICVPSQFNGPNEPLLTYLGYFIKYQGKQNLLQWINGMIPQRTALTNFSSDWTSGEAFLWLVKALFPVPDSSLKEVTKSPIAKVKFCTDFVKDFLSVPEICPEEFVYPCSNNSLLLITYLTELKNAYHSIEAKKRGFDSERLYHMLNDSIKKAELTKALLASDPGITSVSSFNMLEKVKEKKRELEDDIRVLKEILTDKENEAITLKEEATSMSFRVDEEIEKSLLLEKKLVDKDAEIEANEKALEKLNRRKQELEKMIATLELQQQEDKKMMEDNEIIFEETKAELVEERRKTCELAAEKTQLEGSLEQTKLAIANLKDEFMAKTKKKEEQLKAKNQELKNVKESKSQLEKEMSDTEEKLKREMCDNEIKLKREMNDITDKLNREISNTKDRLKKEMKDKVGQKEKEFNSFRKTAEKEKLEHRKRERNLEAKTSDLTKQIEERDEKITTLGLKNKQLNERLRLTTGDLPDVITVTACVQLQWEELGAMLGVPRNKLKKIEKKHSLLSITRCHYEVMRYWIVEIGAYWEALVGALGGSQVAKDIEEKHIKFTRKGRKSQQVYVLKDSKKVSSVDEVLQYGLFHSVDWKVLGLLLGLDDVTLEEIEKANTSPYQEKSLGFFAKIFGFSTTEYRECSEQCQRSLLEHWISTEHAYWSVLVETLAGPVLEEMDIAKTIAKDHQLGEEVWTARDGSDLCPIICPYEIDPKMIKRYQKKITNTLTEKNGQRQPRGIMFAFGMTKVDGTDRDIDNITRTFRDELHFAVYREENPTGEDLAHFIKAAATYTEYPRTCKYKSFFFAGHGGVTEKRQGYFVPVADHEGEVILIRETILAHFQDLKLTDTFIFFFDCCLTHSKSPACSGDAGDENNSMQGGVTLPPAPDPICTTDSKCATEAEDKSLVILPVRGCVIAFATSDGLKSYGTREKGGWWTSNLCKHLKEDLELGAVLSKTYKDVVKELKDEKVQEPMFLSRVGPIYLKEHEPPNDLKRYSDLLYQEFLKEKALVDSIAAHLETKGIIDKIEFDKDVKERKSAVVLLEILENVNSNQLDDILEHQGLQKCVKKIKEEAANPTKPKKSQPNPVKVKQSEPLKSDCLKEPTGHNGLEPADSPKQDTLPLESNEDDSFPLNKPTEDAYKPQQEVDDSDTLPLESNEGQQDDSSPLIKTTEDAYKPQQEVDNSADLPKQELLPNEGQQDDSSPLYKTTEDAYKPQQKDDNSADLPKQDTLPLESNEGQQDDSSPLIKTTEDAYKPQQEVDNSVELAEQAPLPSKSSNEQDDPLIATADDAYKPKQEVHEPANLPKQDPLPLKSREEKLKSNKEKQGDPSPMDNMHKLEEVNHNEGVLSKDSLSIKEQLDS